MVDRRHFLGALAAPAVACALPRLEPAAVNAALARARAVEDQPELFWAEIARASSNVIRFRSPLPRL
jgi:hypothetical protein